MKKSRKFSKSLFFNFLYAELLRVSKQKQNNIPLGNSLIFDQVKLVETKVRLRKMYSHVQTLLQDITPVCAGLLEPHLLDELTAEDLKMKLARRIHEIARKKEYKPVCGCRLIIKLPFDSSNANRESRQQQSGKPGSQRTGSQTFLCMLVVKV